MLRGWVRFKAIPLDYEAFYMDHTLMRIVREADIMDGLIQELEGRMD